MIRKRNKSLKFKFTKFQNSEAVFFEDHKLEAFEIIRKRFVGVTL